MWKDHLSVKKVTYQCPDLSALPDYFLVSTSSIYSPVMLLHYRSQEFPQTLLAQWPKHHCKLKAILKIRSCVLTRMFRAVASAVIVPEESTERPPTPPTTLKRRQSSLTDDRAKRPRLNHDASNGNGNSRQGSVASPPETPINGRQAERRRSGQMEERKRGQRLFGALLGTLSQSSSSTAQKRRTDIEKKQQAKLKMQAEEQDEEKRMKREAIDTVRKGVQRNFDRQSVRLMRLFPVTGFRGS